MLDLTSRAPLTNMNSKGCHYKTKKLLGLLFPQSQCAQ